MPCTGSVYVVHLRYLRRRYLYAGCYTVAITHTPHTARYRTGTLPRLAFTRIAEYARTPERAFPLLPLRCWFIAVPDAVTTLRLLLPHLWLLPVTFGHPPRG